jgi:predicted Zn-dependent peptidase
MENSSNVMNRLGSLEISYGRLFTIEEIVDKVMKVEKEDILRVSRRIFDDFVLALVGPKEKQYDLKKFI